MVQPGAVLHPRPTLLYAGALALGLGLLVLTPRVGSRAVSIGSGLAAGGALATAIVGVAWRGGVPDPLVRGDVAFDLADVAIAAGVAVMVAGVVVYGARNRSRLREPV